MNTKLQLVLLLHFLLRLVDPIVMLVGVFFAKKATRKTTHYGQDPDIQRYVLPNWLSWFNSPDEDGWPMYEPTVAKFYNKLGWRFTMWYNLGTRNVAQGLLWLFGKEVDQAFYLEHKKYNKGEKAHHIYYEWKDENSLNDIVWNLGLFKVVFGWEVCHDHYLSHTKTGYYAIPDISFKK